MLASLLLVACAHRAPPAAPPTERVGAALVEWQFPLDDLGAGAPISPLQARLPAAHPTLAPAFAPNASELSASDPPGLQARLQRHAAEVAEAYASDPSAPPALHLQVSAALPAALEAAYPAGLRVVSFSLGSDAHLGWMDAHLAAHPEVLFVVATPHISGNSVSIEVVDERPAILAANADNLLLVGCLEAPTEERPVDPARPLWEGDGPRGDARAPATVDNQPRERPAPIVFVEGCRARAERWGGPGGTSSAAPWVAAHLVRALPADAGPVGPWLADWLAAQPTTWAVEKDGVVHPVPFLQLYR